jgi:hypothetical protein
MAWVRRADDGAFPVAGVRRCTFATFAGIRRIGYRPQEPESRVRDAGPDAGAPSTDSTTTTDAE